MAGSIIGPLIGAGAGLIGSSSAASAQEDAANAAAATQRYMYDTTRADTAPWRQAGGLALARLAGHYGLGGYGDTQTLTNLGGAMGSGGGGGGGGQAASGASTVGQTGVWGVPWADNEEMRIINGPLTQQMINQGAVPLGGQATAGATADGGGTGDGAEPPSQEDVEATQDSAWEGFLSSPEYRVSREFTGPEMYRSLGASQSAGGRTALNAAGEVANTGALRETSRYAHGLGLSTYGDYANRLASLARLGQTSTQSLGAIGAQYAGNIGAAQLQAGAAQASGYMGAANALGPALGYGAGQLMGGPGFGNFMAGFGSPTGYGQGPVGNMTNTYGQLVDVF